MLRGKPPLAMADASTVKPPICRAKLLAGDHMPCCHILPVGATGVPLLLTLPPPPLPPVFIVGDMKPETALLFDAMLPGVVMAGDAYMVGTLPGMIIMAMPAGLSSEGRLLLTALVPVDSGDEAGAAGSTPLLPALGTPARQRASMAGGSGMLAPIASTVEYAPTMSAASAMTMPHCGLSSATLRAACAEARPVSSGSPSDVTVGMALAPAPVVTAFCEVDRSE